LKARDSLLTPPHSLPPTLTLTCRRQVKQWVETNSVKTAVVVGGGFIGLEVLENLHKMGIKVSLVEMLSQIMPPIDPEMVEPMHEMLRSKGVELFLGDGVAGFEQGEGGRGLVVKTQSGRAHPADLCILAIGVRPETGLAKDAGLELGKRGGIKVDDQMRTSDPSIFAVGDAVEVKDWVTGEMTLIPLAGPANRQGGHNLCGESASFCAGLPDPSAW
jgi:NADPH-dependent 2,4-dienoyl-CoA reductase/sulfur reductase-like enzyme